MNIKFQDFKLVPLSEFQSGDCFRFAGMRYPYVVTSILEKGGNERLVVNLLSGHVSTVSIKTLVERARTEVHCEPPK